MGVLMAGHDEFDFEVFVSTLTAVPVGDRLAGVRKEMVRAQALVVRDAQRRFEQQVYVRRLERLVRYLSGENVSKELSPSETRAYEMLSKAPPAPAEAAPAMGKDRRVSRRIAMKTRVRIRRDSGSGAEVLEPVNVSRGGISFLSSAQYKMSEVVWVNLHYDPKNPEAAAPETRSIIVRAAPESGQFSYGVRFLGG